MHGDIVVEEALEDGVPQKVVPTNPVFLLYFEHRLQHRFYVLAKLRVDFEGYLLKVFDQLILSLGRPGCHSMQHLR